MLPKKEVPNKKIYKHHYGINSEQILHLIYNLKYFKTLINEKEIKI